MDARTTVRNHDGIKTGYTKHVHFDSNGGARRRARWTPAGSGEAPSGAGMGSRDGQRFRQ